MELNLNNVKNIEKYLSELKKFPIHLLAECNRKYLVEYYTFLDSDTFEKLYWLLERNNIRLFDNLKIGPKYSNFPYIFQFQNSNNDSKLFKNTTGTLELINYSKQNIPFYSVIKNTIIVFNGTLLEITDVLHSKSIYKSNVVDCQLLITNTHYVLNVTKQNNSLFDYFYIFVDDNMTVNEGIVVQLNKSFYICKNKNTFTIRDLHDYQVNIGLDVDYVYPNINTHDIIYASKKISNVLYVYKNGFIAPYFEGDVSNLILNTVNRNLYFTYSRDDELYGLQISDNHKFSSRKLDTKFRGFEKAFILEYLESSGNYSYVIDDTCKSVTLLHQYYSIFMAGTNKYVDFMYPQKEGKDIIIKHNNIDYILSNRTKELCDSEYNIINDTIKYAITLQVGIKPLILGYVVICENAIYQSDNIIYDNIFEIGTDKILDYLLGSETKEIIRFRKICNNTVGLDKINMYINFIK